MPPQQLRCALRTLAGRTGNTGGISWPNGDPIDADIRRKEELEHNCSERRAFKVHASGATVATARHERKAEPLGDRLAISAHVT